MRIWTIVAALALFGFTTMAFAAGMPSFSARRFDLLCNLHSRAVSHSRQEPVVGTYQADAKSWWDIDVRLAVDLDIMQYCDPVTCAQLGPRPIASLTVDKINLDNKPYETWFINRQNGRSVERLIDAGTVSLTAGWCRKAKFSGLYWYLKNRRVVQGPAQP
jgi:hypothetical protein